MENNPRYLFRLIVPAFPSFNVFSALADKTTALGPICVATAANKLEKWDVEVIDENNYKNGPKDEKKWPDHKIIQQNRPADVVGFYGSLSCTIPRLYQLAAFYKSLNIKTVAGGKHIESLPEEALSENIDIAVLGEGEEAIKEILTALENNADLKKIRGIVYKDKGEIVKTEPRPLITNFDILPLPDFGLLRYANKISLYPINRSRGCNMNCEFCAVKEKARCSSAERLLFQVAKLVETKNARHFFVVDDHFSEGPDDAIKFCYLVRDYQRQIGKKLGFSVQIRLNDAKNTALLTAMKAAGVNNVFIGYESPIDEELISMRKGYLSKDMTQWTNIFHQFGFFVHGMFIFGYPRLDNQKPTLTLTEKVKRFKRFVNYAKIDTIQILLTVPIPGTDLRKRLEKENRVFPKEIVGWEYYDGQFPLFTPDDGVSPEELQRAAGKIMSGFYHFHHFWKVGLKILYFPVAMMPAIGIKDIKINFKHWLYGWRNDIKRFGGHILVTKWFRRFKKDNFLEKLKKISR